MTLVVDPSAVIDLLCAADRGDRVPWTFPADRAEEHMATVAHLDADVCSGLARLYRADVLDADDVVALLRRLGDLAVVRLALEPLAGCSTSDTMLQGRITYPSDSSAVAIPVPQVPT